MRPAGDVGEIKKTILESFNEILHERAGKLKQINQLLRNVCRSIDDRTNNCNCLNFPDTVTFVMRKSCEGRD